MTDKSPRSPQQLAVAKFHAKRVAQGWRKVTVWLGPDSLDRLEELRVEAGSKDKAIRRALLFAPTKSDMDAAPWMEDF